MQAWDRFAYVNNNPLKYTDPSGHGAICGDDYDPACQEANESWDPGYQSLWQRKPSSEPASSGIEQCFAPTNSTSAPTSDAWANSDAWAAYGGIVYDGTNTYIDFVSKVNPLYRHLKGLIPGPIGEGVISAGFQVISDIGGDYTFPQRVGRGIVAGVEGMVTDEISTAAGITAASASALTGPGAVVVYAGTSLAMNEAMEFGIWPSFNSTFFGFLGY